MSSFSSSRGDQESKSGANPGPDWILDNRVFLSFRGQDSPIVSFTTDLHRFLQNAGASVISIDEELRSIDQISTSSLQEIQRSRGSVIVFSKDYADSGFCLEELEKIMECRRTMGQVVVPVFYGVDAAEVRHQTGKFGEAFEDLIKRKSIEKDKVFSWREALHDAGGISGFVVTDSRHESEAIKNVVDHVTDHLLDSTDLFVAEHLVGLQSRVLELISLLDHQESKNVILVGICGMPGVGKTTIAKAVYNQISPHFEGRKFLPNIGEIWEKDSSGVSLQERLLSSIYKTTKIKIDSIESGKLILKERLCHKRMFLVFDDVDELEQLNALCGNREWFGPGSRIIITTRAERLLAVYQVERVYGLKGLNEEESLELLSWYEFNQACPKRDFTELSRKVVHYSQGLPLALEVFGSHPLFGKGMTEWQRALDKLNRFLGPVKYQVLRRWFNDLDDTEKRIFLDIACFFIGLDRNEVIQALSGSGHSAETGISVLEEQGFVTVDEKNKLVMHVLLRNLAKDIIWEESRNELGPKIFDVFLSFRGDDTRASFTSHLYSSLQNAGIYVFKDDDEIQRGDQISISLLQAIGKSRIAVIVLSRNYANSRWCLQELENIMESRRTTGLVVLPVFYGVDPSEVRNQTGVFGQAFEDMLKRISVEKDKVQSWRKALLEVGGIAGFVVINSRNESEDIMKVVENITHLLDRTDLFVAQHPVGVKSRVQKVIKILNSQQSNDPLLLGIWGMGGSGKTTIAKAIYNEIGRQFEGRSFLLNVREVWKQANGQVHLQEQLLSDVYKTTKIKIHSIESGKSILKERLGQKKVLIVLDDVDNLEQLNALSGSHEWFRPGSVIIITTRDEHLLKVRRVKVYPMEEMDESESVELFSWHAFKQANPKEEFAGLSGKVIDYSGRLPLALEVLGSYLFEREIKEWQSVLDKLESIPNNRVQEKLKISFDGLNDDKEREIFLDIAFFFIGMDRSDVIQILNACGHFAEIGISVLVERSLVTVDSKNKLRMHDLLRDMGREIIREKSPEEPEERSRLWHPEDVLDVLSKHMGTKAIKGLALKLPRINPICHLETEAFKKMNRLRLLQLVGVQLDGDFKYLSRDLRWLCWHGFPSTYTPANFEQRSLVAISLKYSNLRLVWKKGQFLEKLKILNLSHSHGLIQTPDFSKLPNLEKLTLKDCPNLSEVSHTIGHLNRLLLINLKDCTSLRNLPRSIYKLKSLKTLILSGCLMIDKLEEDLEQMESLTSLIADNTAITQVPFSVVRLKNIGYISLCGYEGLSREVFPSLIWSWNSPTNILSSLVQTSAAMSSSDFSDLPKDPSLLVGCGSELGLTGDVARIWDTLNPTNCKELEGTPTTSQVSNMKTSSLIECRSRDDISGSKNSLNSLLIKMGMNCQMTNILEESILQKLNTCESGDCLLPGDKNPDWLTFNDEGSSVIFEVPQVKGRNLKTMTLCVVYSSSPDIITSEGLKNVLIVNYTKITTQVCDRDTLISFKDEEWQSVISNLEPSNKVQVVVVLGNGFIVKKTAVYLVYDEPIDEKMEDYHATDKGVIVSDDNNMAAEDKNVPVSGGDDRVADESFVVSSGDDVAANKNVSVSGSDDTVVNKNVIVCVGDDMPADKNVDLVSDGDENRFRRLFTLPSLVRAVLISRPFWFGLAVILVCTCLRFDKRRSGNLVSRYTVRWKWLMGCIKKLIAYKKGNRGQIAIKSSSRV